MISIDTNIFIFAVDGRSPYKSTAIELLQEVFAGEERVFLCWEVLHGFRRIATSTHILKEALTPEKADTFIDDLIGHPLAITLSPTKESWQIFKRYSREMNLIGNLVTDAIIASQLEANGVKKIYSNDRDFRKFTNLRVIDPFVKKRR